MPIKMNTHLRNLLIILMMAPLSQTLFAQDLCTTLAQGSRHWDDNGSIITAKKSIISCNYSGNDLEVTSKPVAGSTDKAIVSLKLKKHGLFCPDAGGDIPVICKNNTIQYDSSTTISQTAKLNSFKLFNSEVDGLLLSLSESNGQYHADGTGSAEDASLDIHLNSNTAQYQNLINYYLR
ncbi:MAG: hypothetical protein EP298_08995 [Gammaproteobacteria bacterium]|nr:MAG: hypothetical protein EP298_08995 [Gammaproteobacteria bacterium]UTW42379.1 hypothetical protein KFE69_12995 [bacterium SCSIO 12844]